MFGREAAEKRKPENSDITPKRAEEEKKETSPDSLRKPLISSTTTTTFNDKAGLQLGFDLRGSLANITTWIEESDSEDDSSPSPSPSPLSAAGRSGAPGAPHKTTPKTPKTALSREDLLQQCQAVVAPPSSDDENCDTHEEIPYPKGHANSMSDKELIALLKQQPKDVPEMRTRESFRRFFARMKKDRFEYLLRAANADKSTKDGDKKVAKRMALTADILKK